MAYKLTIYTFKQVSLIFSLSCSLRDETVDIVCLPRLSKKQEARLPEDYVAPPVEGMYDVDEKHPDGIIFIYVGACDWEKNFEYCLREFVLTVFHEVMHVTCPDVGDYVPYAEKVLAEVLNDR